MLCLFFFFKQKTAYEMRISDWSSDVCSSDLKDMLAAAPALVLALCERVDGDESVVESESDLESSSSMPDSGSTATEFVRGTGVDWDKSGVLLLLLSNGRSDSARLSFSGVTTETEQRVPLCFLSCQISE